jgi:integrase
MSGQPVDEAVPPVPTQGLKRDLDMQGGSSFERYQRRKADNTIRRHKADLALFEIYLAEGGQSISQLISLPSAWHSITAELVELFVEWQIEQGYAIKSINARLSTVKRYAGLAYRAGGISSEELLRIREIKEFRRVEGRRIDAKRSVTRVGEKKAAPTFLTEEQLLALFQVPDLQTPQGWRDLFLLRLLYDLGLRPGEIVTMVLADLDLQRETLHVHRHKTDGEQSLRLTPGILHAANHYIEVRKDREPSSPLLVGSRKGRQLIERVTGKDGTVTTPPMSHSALFQRMHTLGKAIGVNLNAYDARHQWTRDALEAGNALIDVLDAGGWSKDSPMARRYSGERAIANERIRLNR